MDGVSAVAGVATAGVQLSKSLYDLYSTVRTSRHEIQDVANNVSLLAMVLEELDEVLYDDEKEYRPQLREAAHSIALRCACIFKDIRKHTGTDRELKGQKFYEKVAWYFKRERVKPLRISLESLKSTLNILLHVIQLAKNTRGIEEYPGVKSIGQWYVRRERRGLVYLVIDNRHAVEQLKQMEQQNGQDNRELIENERPLAFADIFPLSTTTRKRGKSPERKFIVTFSNPACRMDDDYQPSQEPEIDFLQASPSTPHSERVLVASPSQGSRSPLHLPTDSDAESISRSTSSQSMRKSRMRARATDEPSTSRLILDVIPHETADRALKSAQNMSRSTLLEAKAEETIDLLMRHWTYLEPEYFSEDDHSSISSTRPSIPLLRVRNVQHLHQGERLAAAERLGSPREDYSGQPSDLVDTSNLTIGLDKSQILQSEDETGPSSPSRLKRGSSAVKTPEPASPSPQSGQGDQEAKSKLLSYNLTNQAPQTPQEPSTPAPPYPSSHPGQCRSCAAASGSGFRASTEPHQYQPTDAQTSDAETRNAPSTSMDSALRLFETRFLEIIKQISMVSIEPDARLGQVSEQEEQGKSLAQSATIESEAEPVILKDCLGRKFLFPIKKCRSWQNMENLIKRSFSHVETMNSKIFRGSYDILSPTGEIILPEIWDSVIKPGWIVELRFWDSATAAEACSKDAETGVVEAAPVVQSSPTVSSESNKESGSPVIQLAMAKRRASLRTWLGNRKSTPSAAFG